MYPTKKGKFWVTRLACLVPGLQVAEGIGVGWVVYFYGLGRPARLAGL